MEQQFQHYIQTLVADCINSPKFASLSEEQKKQTETNMQLHFMFTIMNTLLDYLNETQLKEFNELDLQSPEALTRIEKMAMQVPEFMEAAQTRVLEEAEKIKQTGTVPEV